MRYLFKSNNLIGDGLYTSGALRSWLKAHYTPGDIVYMQTLPDHIQHLYPGMVRDMNIDMKIVYERPELPFEFEHVFDVTPAFVISNKEKVHIAEAYAKLLGVELEGVGRLKLKPTYIPEYNEDTEGHNLEIVDLHDCILISMYSMSCSSRGNTPGPPNKMIPWEKWKPMIELLRKEFPKSQIRTLGSEHDTQMTPMEFRRFLLGNYVEPMHAIPLNRLAIIMQNAKLLVTIDNGMGHLAASQGLNTFLMYPRALMPHYIVPFGNLKMDYIHIDPVAVSVGRLVSGLEYTIKRVKEG